RTGPLGPKQRCQHLRFGTVDVRPLAALTPGDERLPSRTLGADTSVSALVGLYGLYDLLDQQTYWPRLFNLFERWVFKTTLRESPGEYRWASPMHHDQRDAPPTLIIFGDRD